MKHSAARITPSALVLALLSTLFLVAAGPAMASKPSKHPARAATCLASSAKKSGRHTATAPGCRAAKAHPARVAKVAPASKKHKTTTKRTPAPSPTPKPTPTPTPTPSSSVLYWGAAVGTQFTGELAPWDMNAQTDFQKADAGGKGASVLPWGMTFYSAPYCGGYCTFTTSLYQQANAAGMIPWINWQSASSTGTSGYTDAQIAAGSQDAYITQWAQAARAWGHPFFLRFDWEMNASWFPWGVGANGNTAADYVAMWKHVHDIFTKVGATNASWVWCPNIDPSNMFAPITTLYPGDAYVDWTCLDGYNGNDPWTSFQQLFQSSYTSITTTIAPTKPMFVGETGCTESGGSKAAWITSMFSSLQTNFPQIHGLMWFDVSGAGPGGYSDWPLESSTSAQAAFAAGINRSNYVANNYANLTASPIPVPTAS